MPRPPRCRRICGAPQVDTFCPNGCENTEPILLTLDEYEVIRLVDLVHWKRNPTTCRLCLGGTFLSVKRLDYRQR